MDSSQAFNIFDEIRESIKDSNIHFNDDLIAVTVSLGVVTKMQESLNKMITAADQALYKAKSAGRNRVVVE